MPDYGEPVSPDIWSPGPRQNGNGGRPAWAGGPSTEHRQRMEPGAWALAERAEHANGAATYREGGGGDWRRDLADRGEPGDGEERRSAAGDFAPFRPSGSAAARGSSNLSTTSTSLISPVPREQRESWARPQRAGGYQGLSGAYERRPVTGGFPMGRRSDLLDPDDEEDDDQDSGGPLAAVGYTVIWYGVPIVLFVIYMLVVKSDSRSHALDTLAGAAPQFGISLVLSILLAIGLRKFQSSWKAVSVGLAAAVVGGGLATVLSSAITGNSLS
jgi:hypothetical protein